MKADNSGVSEEVFFQITNRYMDTPFHRLLGMEITEIKPGEVAIELTPTEDLLNGHGTVHGGATASLCDTAMGVAVLSLEKRPITVEMKLNYLLPLKPGEKLKAVGRVVRAGGTIIVAEAEVFDGEKLAIKALGTYMDVK